MMDSMRIGVAMVLVAGCASQDAARDAGTATHALVRAEVSYARAGAELRYDARAHFARFRGVDPAHLPALLGWGWGSGWGWPDAEPVPLDACLAFDAAAALDQALADAR